MDRRGRLLILTSQLWVTKSVFAGRHLTSGCCCRGWSWSRDGRLPWSSRPTDHTGPQQNRKSLDGVSLGRENGAGFPYSPRRIIPAALGSPYVLMVGRLPILLAFLAVAAPLRAQELPASLRTGERVRVSARGGEPVSGIATSIAADGLQVSDSSGVVHTFNRNDIALVERSLGCRWPAPSNKRLLLTRKSAWVRASRLSSDGPRGRIPRR